MIGATFGAVVRPVSRALALSAALLVPLLGAASSSADEWWPHPANAQWNYEWSDSSYNQAGPRRL